DERFLAKRICSPWGDFPPIRQKKANGWGTEILRNQPARYLAAPDCATISPGFYTELSYVLRGGNRAVECDDTGTVCEGGSGAAEILARRGADSTGRAGPSRAALSCCADRGDERKGIDGGDAGVGSDGSGAAHGTVYVAASGAAE